MIIINSEIKISLCFTIRRNDRRMKKEKEKDEIQAQIDSVLEKIFNEDSYNNENSQIKGMVA